MHIDGFNFLPYLTGQADTGPRENFFYVSDEGQIMAIRMGDWKAVFYEQRAHRIEEHVGPIEIEFLRLPSEPKARLPPWRGDRLLAHGFSRGFRVFHD